MKYSLEEEGKLYMKKNKGFYFHLSLTFGELLLLLILSIHIIDQFQLQIS
jgi:hypothetical protein